jgi:thiosulfate dehydrogenase [quinone] large subunit
LGKSTPSPTSTTSSSAGLIKLAALPVGATFEFNSALAGPAMLFRTAKGVFAYSLTCTHQGCVVAYSKSAKQLQCPCHGAQFDPFNGAKVLAGPAPTPLAPIKVKISGDWVVEA